MSIPDSEWVWISETDVVSVMSMAGAIEALERGLAAEAQGHATNMLKTHVAWDGSTLHAIGAVFARDGFAGTKTWAHTARGAAPLLILFDADTGQLRAVIEAFALGQMRTAAASGVATRWLAGKDAAEMAVIGTGKQAFAQVAAVTVVRNIRRIAVFSPNVEHRSQFAERLRKDFNLEVTPAGSVPEAVKDAGIITTITRAKEPFLSAEMIRPGTHINAVGAILPGRAEVSPDVLHRCTQVVSDSPAQARQLSTELIGHFGSDDVRWSRVRSLADVVASRQNRNENDDLTLLKSLGTGILDLSLGTEIYREVVRRNIGRLLPQPQRAALRIR